MRMRMLCLHWVMHQVMHRLMVLVSCILQDWTKRGIEKVAGVAARDPKQSPKVPIDRL